MADPLMANPALIVDVLGRDGFNIGLICKSFGFKAADLAALTHRETEAVARHVANNAFVKPEHSLTRDVMSQLVQILGLLRAMKLDEQAGTWIRTPLPSYEGRSPLDLVREGKGQELVTRLLALAVGDAGG